MKPHVLIITYNEELNIRKCLKSVPNDWKCTIVDSGSTDRTTEIARELGVTVILQSWLGFGRQKQFAVNSYSPRWILSMDADEQLTEALITEIEALNSDSVATAYRIPRQSYFLGNAVFHCGWRPDYVVRLFHSAYCTFTDSLIHESVGGFKCLKTLKNDLIHHPYQSKRQVDRKIQLYGALGRQSVKDSGKHQSSAMAALKFIWTFLRTFVFRLGFMDGVTGYKISLMNAKVSYVKYSSASGTQNSD